MGMNGNEAGNESDSIHVRLRKYILKRISIHIYIYISTYTCKRIHLVGSSGIFYMFPFSAGGEVRRGNSLKMERKKGG